jgi:membrane associated rhomboid family serine protease
MLPIGNDDKELFKIWTPWITYSLILVNVLCFIYEILADYDVIGSFGFIPQQISTYPFLALITLFTYMFLHTGISHIFGNMVFLWIFGKDMEAAMGRGFFLLFYLMCGVYGALAQYLVDSGSAIPLVGASGAIAGIMGAYIVLFWGKEIRVLFFWILPIRMPAFFFLGLWLLLQICSTVSLFSQPDSGSGGVAYLVHLSGFFIGLIVGFYVRHDILTRAREAAEAAAAARSQ